MDNMDLKTEQLNQKCTPKAREKLDDILKKMGYSADPKTGHVKWDEDKLIEMIGIVESTIVLSEHGKYRDVITSINQYSTLINAKLVSLISDLDNTEARIRSEYENAIAAKDKIISGLQNERDTLELERNTAINDYSSSKKAQAAAEKMKNDVQAALADKENLIKMLSDKVSEYASKANDYESLTGKIRNMELSMHDMEKQIAVLQAELRVKDDMIGILREHDTKPAPEKHSTTFLDDVIPSKTK